MEIKRYPRKRICREFYDVIAFLKRYGAKGYNQNWHWARWEWLLGHSSLQEASLPTIGICMEDGKIAGLVTHDMRDPAYILLNPEYARLKLQMVEYAAQEFLHGGTVQLYTDEKDTGLISVLREQGFSPTANEEHTLALNCDRELTYGLDGSFSVRDFHMDKNIDRYVAVIHKGFGNEGMPLTGLTEADFPERPHENPRLAVFITDADGTYAAHCGTWYTPDTETCYVEPVVTIPSFRGRGLGKAAVYESINRCIRMGAKRAVVISNLPFYHRIGFREYSVCRMWEKKI